MMLRRPEAWRASLLYCRVEIPPNLLAASMKTCHSLAWCSDGLQSPAVSPRPCPPHSQSPASPPPHFCYTNFLCLDYPELTLVSAPLQQLMGLDASQGAVSSSNESERHGLMRPLPCEAATPTSQFPTQHFLSPHAHTQCSSSSCNYIFTHFFTHLLSLEH